jgi:hypothetical protein
MDLGLPRTNLVLTLFGFNCGVEIGQMCVVAAFLPLAYLARRSPLYRVVGLVSGSVVIAAIASVWLVERAFVVKILSPAVRVRKMLRGPSFASLSPKR